MKFDCKFIAMKNFSRLILYIIVVTGALTIFTGVMWLLTLDISTEMSGANEFWYYFFLITIIFDCLIFIAFAIEDHLKKKVKD